MAHIHPDCHTAVHPWSGDGRLVQRDRDLEQLLQRPAAGESLPISYSDVSPDLWNHFPRMILDATYEATFFVAARNRTETGCKKLFLTLVGGGVFGNQQVWILDVGKIRLSCVGPASFSLFLTL